MKITGIILPLDGGRIEVGLDMVCFPLTTTLSRQGRG